LELVVAEAVSVVLGYVLVSVLGLRVVAARVAVEAKSHVQSAAVVCGDQ